MSDLRPILLALVAACRPPAPAGPAVPVLSDSPAPAAGSPPPAQPVPDAVAAAPAESSDMSPGPGHVPSGVATAGPLFEPPVECPPGPIRCVERFEPAHFRLEIALTPAHLEVLPLRQRVRAAERDLLDCGLAIRRRDACVREGFVATYLVASRGALARLRVEGLPDPAAHACVDAALRGRGLASDAGPVELRVALIYVPAQQHTYVSSTGQSWIGPTRRRPVDPPCRPGL